MVLGDHIPPGDAVTAPRAALALILIFAAAMLAGAAWSVT